MRLFGQKPAFWPTVMTLPAVLVGLALGIWQLDRREWKAAIIADRVAKSSALPLGALPERFDPAEHEFRTVRVSGRFLHDKEMFQGAKSLRGNPGYHVLTPLALEGGGHLLISRGWVPLERKLPEGRRPGQVTGTVAIVGVLRAPVGRTNWLARQTVPDNRPDQNFWFFIDLPAMAQASGLPDLKPYYLEAGAAPNPGGFPIGGQARIELPNDHLQYAITWFAIAATGIVIYLLFHRRRAREKAA